jgi:hypothetical protein
VLFAQRKGADYRAGIEEQTAIQQEAASITDTASLCGIQNAVRARAHVYTYIGANRLRPKVQERLNEAITSEMAQTGQLVSIPDSKATQTILCVIESKLNLL